MSPAYEWGWSTLIWACVCKIVFSKQSIYNFKIVTMEKLCTLFFLLISFSAFSQAPFTTLVKEPRVVKKKATIDGKEIYISLDKKEDEKIKKNVIDSESGEADGGKETEKQVVDFFSNNSLSVNLLLKGEERVSVASQVLHYKLYVANPTEDNKYRLNRYNVPLLLITKLSTSYDTINASSAIDVLDYEAAPLTIRTMPSFKKAFKTYNDVFYFGFYADLRGLNIYNPNTNDYSMELVGSGGFGLTFQGDGAAGTYNSKGEYEQGRYSLSLMLQGAVGDKTVLSKLFETDKNYVGSFQAYLLFKVSEKSQLNFKVGYHRLFQKTLSGTNQNISITLGI